MSSSATSRWFLNTSRDDHSITTLGSIIQGLANLLVKNLSQIPNLLQLEAVSSCPIARYLEGQTDPHLATISLQGAVERHKVPLSLVFSLLGSPCSLPSADRCPRLPCEVSPADGTGAPRLRGPSRRSRSTGRERGEGHGSPFPAILVSSPRVQHF